MAEIREVPERGIRSDNARSIIYIVLAAGLAIAGVLGFIDADEAETILDNIVQLAGALGFGLAAANKPKIPGQGQTKATPDPDNPAPNTRDVGH